MSTNSSIIPYLFLVTFAIVLVYGVMQFFKAKKAKAEGHTSASARANHEAPGAASPGSAGTSNRPAAPPTVPR